MRSADAHRYRASASARGRLAAAAALLLGSLACGGEGPSLEPIYDLGENLAYATVTGETAEIAIGEPGDAAHLSSGWSHPETEARSGRSFRWGLEPASELTFTVVEPRDVALRLEGRPRRGPDGTARTVDLMLNGQPAGRLELATGRREYSLVLSTDQLRRGANRLRLDYDLGDVRAVPSAEDRQIAVAWYRLAFDGLGEPAGAPRVDAERGVLFLPYGSRLDFYLDAPDGAALRSPRRRFVTAPGRLTVALASDGGGEVRLAETHGEGELEVPLPGAGAGPIRLSLAAVPDGPSSSGGIALDHPAVWADAPAAASPPATPVATRDGALPNVVIYLVDTLRADHLGCYGHERGVSPRIDRFAAQATLFENMRAQAPWTLPSVASVMTGLWPPEHGVFEDSRRLAPEVETLAEALAGAGYQTAAVVTNGFATGAYGLDQGFDEMTLIKTEGRKSRQVHEATVDWLGRRDRERPFYLYLHTVDPHKPYLPDEEERLRWAGDADEIWRQIVANPRKQRWEPSESVIAQLKALYDAEVAQNDKSFGDTLDALEAAGLYDDALIVFLSDHGEEFYEHQAWTHASNVYPEVLNVPLIVKLPGQRQGHRVAELAQHIDLMPTLLTYLGIAAPPGQGRRLPALLGPSPDGPRRVFSHTKRKSQSTASVIDGDWKLIRRSDENGVTERLFNWRDDPDEFVDLAPGRPVLAGFLAAVLERRLVESVPAGLADAAPDEEVLENLRALGYVD